MFKPHHKNQYHMRNFTLLCLAFAMLMVIACKQAEQKSEEETTPEATEEQAEKPKHWSYDGETSPEHWAEIEKESSCGGSHQSPIDIVTANVVAQPSGLTAEDIHYDAETIIHDVTNNGHSVQYNFSDHDNYVNYKGKRYDLAQFHFHAASEHAVDGMHYPLVAHMVHVSEDKEFVVFAVFVTEGGESDAFDFIESYLPVNPGETKTIGQPHHFSGYLKNDFSHYYYHGSLTTPPCTEAVNWFLFKDPIKASPEQVKALADLMPRNNYRPTQPLNDRTVYVSE